MLATVAVQGALKTNAVIALVFPLVILAVPILDSSFVVAKRIKHGKPVHVADRWHFHHRFANIGFSQRRTVLYLYGWTIALAALALALRFVPYSDDHGHFNLGWSLVMVAFAIPALVASVYLVLVLEILKLKRFRQFQLRRARMLEGEPPPGEAEVDARRRPRARDGGVRDRRRSGASTSRLQRVARAVVGPASARRAPRGARLRERPAATSARTTRSCSRAPCASRVASTPTAS